MRGHNMHIAVFLCCVSYSDGENKTKGTEDAHQSESSKIPAEKNQGTKCRCISLFLSSENEIIPTPHRYIYNTTAPVVFGTPPDTFPSKQSTMMHRSEPLWRCAYKCTAVVNTRLGCLSTGDASSHQSPPSKERNIPARTWSRMITPTCRQGIYYVTPDITRCGRCRTAENRSISRFKFTLRWAKTHLIDTYI